MTLDEARARVKPGEYIMMLPGPGRYDPPSHYIVVDARHRLLLSPRWVTWESGPKSEEDQ